MVKNKDRTTEGAILEAARRVFHERGLAGARMQQIADEAGINKALLHYYFRSKDQLFKAVFLEAFGTVVPRINEIFNADLPLFEKIRVFTEEYISLVLKNPYLPSFIIQEMNNNPHFAKEYLADKRLPRPQKLLQQIKDEVEAGNIRPVDPVQTVISLMALCIFPFVAGEMIKGVAGLSKKEYEQLLVKRKKEVAEFIINAIKL